MLVQVTQQEIQEHLQFFQQLHPQVVAEVVETVLLKLQVDQVVVEKNLMDQEQLVIHLL